MTVIEFKSSRATLAQRRAVFVELRADLRRALELLTVCGSPLAPGESAAYRADAERHLVAVERQLAATCTETVAAVRTPSLVRELLLVVRMLAERNAVDLGSLLDETELAKGAEGGASR